MSNTARTIRGSSASSEVGLKSTDTVSLRNRLSKIFSLAVRWGYVQSNPVKGAQVSELTYLRKRVALTPEQFWALSQELSEPYRAMALVAVLSGMRSGEVFGLRWRDVDFVERSILVAETVYQGVLRCPKPQLPIAKSLSMT
jgi:integrase